MLPQPPLQPPADYEPTLQVQPPSAPPESSAALAGAPAPALSQADGLPIIPDVLITAELGRGGMGTVYRGRQQFIDRDVAVKVLHHELATGDFVQRFQREAKLLARMSHPSIVSCLAAGTTEAGISYIVMELIDGPDLSHWLKDNGRMETGSAIRLALAICRALSYGYASGIIHRDIKTANVLLAPQQGTVTDGAFPFHAKLADLGLARPQVQESDSSMALTQPGVAMGTPSCMAPEQFGDPDNVDLRTDIYGLGCVLFHCLTGQAAFPQQGLSKLFKSKMNPVAPAPRDITPDIPKRLSKVVAKMLATEAEDRHPTYDELEADLEALLTEPATVDVQRSKSWLLIVPLLAVTAIVLWVMNGGGDDGPAQPGDDNNPPGLAAKPPLTVAPPADTTQALADGEDGSEADLPTNVDAELADDLASHSEQGAPELEVELAPPEPPLITVDLVVAGTPTDKGLQAGLTVGLVVNAPELDDGTAPSLSWSVIDAPADALPSLEHQLAGFDNASQEWLWMPRVAEMATYEIVIEVQADYGGGILAHETFHIDVDSTYDIRSIRRDFALMDADDLMGFTTRPDSARNFSRAGDYPGPQARSKKGESGATAASAPLPRGDWQLRGAFRALHVYNHYFSEAGLWIGSEQGPVRMLAITAIRPADDGAVQYELNTSEFLPEFLPLYGPEPHPGTAGHGLAHVPWGPQVGDDVSREVDFTVTKNGTKLSIVVAGQQENAFVTILIADPTELGLFAVGGLGDFRDFKLSPLEP